jgi:integral membrane protein (TIGR01906 family)
MTGEITPAVEPAPEARLSPGTRLRRVLPWVVMVLVPVVLVLTAVRLLLNPAFLIYEYNTPGFPQDPIGFTREERLHWAGIALEYLVNQEGIEFLGDLRFDDGRPVYNDRELRHMVDVKQAVQATLWVWRLSMIALVALSIWAWQGGWAAELREGLRRGGWLTVFLLLGILVLVLFAWRFFFVLFHNIFFEEGTWMFEFTDTLIRLFPERFWSDIFIIIGGFALLFGLALGLGLRRRR